MFRYAVVTGSGSHSRTNGKVPRVRNIRHLIEQQTGRPKRRLDSCAACLFALSSSPVCLLPIVHYRSQAGKLESPAGKTRSWHAWPGRMPQSGRFTCLTSRDWGRTRKDFCTSYPQNSRGLLHGSPTGIQRVSHRNRHEQGAASSLNLFSGTQGDGNLRALPSLTPGFPIPCESTHVGLTPSVLAESCPSLGQSKKGGAVPPETNGHLL